MIWVEGATNWNHWKEVNKQESSEAPVRWMASGRSGVAAKVSESGSEGPTDQTDSRTQSHLA